MPQKRLRIKNKKELLSIELFVNHVKKSLGDNLSFIKLFGSKARGTADKDSDIDILIVTKDYSKDKNKIFDILFKIDPYYEFKISPVIYSIFEYQQNELLGSPFVEKIKKESIDL